MIPTMPIVPETAAHTVFRSPKDDDAGKGVMTCWCARMPNDKHFFEFTPSNSFFVILQPLSSGHIPVPAPSWGRKAREGFEAVGDDVLRIGDVFLWMRTGTGEGKRLQRTNRYQNAAASSLAPFNAAHENRSYPPIRKPIA